MNLLAEDIWVRGGCLDSDLVSPSSTDAPDILLLAANSFYRTEPISIEGSPEKVHS